MADPYIGEIRMFAGTAEPLGWAFCDGRVLPIAENSALYDLIGARYGGDGESTFALPDLRGRLPLHAGAGFALGDAAGTEQETLAVDQIPVHTHDFLANGGPGADVAPTNNAVAGSPNVSLFRQGTPATGLSPQASGPTGGSGPHTNLQPYLCVNFIIALSGTFPDAT